MKERILVISGPSGAGKTTVMKSMLNEFGNLEFSVSATTRDKREGETDGKDYYFLSTSDFREKIKNNELLEYQEVYPGLFYGTLRSEIKRILDSGKIPALDVDVVGALNVRKLFEGETLAIFIHPGEIDTLEKRLKERKSESNESLKERISKASRELGFAGQFDYIVNNNGDLQHTLEQVRKIIRTFIGKA